MDSYKCLQQLEIDLEYARNNPHDLVFFDEMLERYRNSDQQMQAVLKSALFDRMLEHNPLYMIEKLAKENPNKIIFYNTQQDPFFYT